MNLFRTLNITGWKPDFFIRTLPCGFLLSLFISFPSSIFLLYPGFLTHTIFHETLLTYWSSSIRIGRKKKKAQIGYSWSKIKIINKIPEGTMFNLQTLCSQNIWVSARSFEIVFSCLLFLKKSQWFLKRKDHTRNSYYNSNFHG